jgi:hypothetical protein
MEHPSGCIYWFQCEQGYKALQDAKENSPRAEELTTELSQATTLKANVKVHMAD